MPQRVGVHANAQLQHHQHADDHDDRLDEQRRFEMLAEPELNTQDIRDQQCQAHVIGEAFGILRTFDDQILRDVGNHATKLQERERE